MVHGIKKSTAIRSERVTAHVHILKSLQETFSACSYTLPREMNLILWMQITAIFFKANLFVPLNRKDENNQLLLTLVFCHEKQDAINKLYRLDQFFMEILNIPCHRIWYNTQISCWACRFLGHESYHNPNHDALVIQSSDFFFSSSTCRRPFHFTPLKKGSLYDTATLCFLFLAVRGAFLLQPEESFETGRFELKEEADKWHANPSTGTIQVNIKSGD